MEKVSKIIILISIIFLFLISPVIAKNISLEMTFLNEGTYRFEKISENVTAILNASNITNEHWLNESGDTGTGDFNFTGNDLLYVSEITSNASTDLTLDSGTTITRINDDLYLTRGSIGKLFGGDSAGDDLEIYPNPTDISDRIIINPASGIIIDTQSSNTVDLRVNNNDQIRLFNNEVWIDDDLVMQGYNVSQVNCLELGSTWICNVSEVNGSDTHVGGVFPWLINNTTDMWFNESLLNSTILNFTTSTTHRAIQNRTLNGTWVIGNLTSLWTSEDDDTYNVTEGAGVNNALTVEINFTNVTSFDSVIGRVWYQGGSGHIINLEIWRNDTQIWESYAQYTDMGGFTNIYIPMFDPANHIDGGNNVSLRFHHPANGNPSHRLVIDYISLIDGFTPLIISEHDALSGRNVTTNHPWALPIDGTRNMSGDLRLNENFSMGTNKIFYLDDDNDTKIYTYIDDHIVIVTGDTIRAQLNEGILSLNSSSHLMVPLGSELRFDDNSYLTQIANDIIGIFTGGVERVRIQNESIDATVNISTTGNVTTDCIKHVGDYWTCSDGDNYTIESTQHKTIINHTNISAGIFQTNFYGTNSSSGILKIAGSSVNINPSLNIYGGTELTIGNNNKSSVWNWSTEGWQTYAGNTSSAPYTFEQAITDHDMHSMVFPPTRHVIVGAGATIRTGWEQPNGEEIPIYAKWYVSDDADVAEDIPIWIEYVLDNAVSQGWINTNVDWICTVQATYECDDVSAPPFSNVAQITDSITIIDYHHEILSNSTPCLIPGGSVTPGDTVDIQVYRIPGNPDEDFEGTVYLTGLRPMKREIAQGYQTPR